MKEVRKILTVSLFVLSMILQPNLNAVSQTDISKAIRSGSSGGASATKFPVSGDNKLLVIMVEFDDGTFTYTRHDFEEMMSLKNYKGIGSFADYWRDQSAGTLNLSVTVKGPYKLQKKRSDYIERKQIYTYDSDTTEYFDNRALVADALDKVKDNINVSDFDNDNDGIIDGVMVIYNGERYEQFPMYTYYAPLSDSVRVNTHGVVSEIYNKQWGMTGIGPLCKEFAKMLGMSELDWELREDYSINLDVYDLMTKGFENNKTHTPVNCNIIQRLSAGWAELDTICDRA